MFSNNYSPAQRFKEYHNVERIMREMTVYGQAESTSPQEKADTKDLMAMLRRRQKEISAAMKADCERCFGTGQPMRFRSAFATSYSHCTVCGKEAKLSRDEVLATINF